MRDHDNLLLKGRPLIMRFQHLCAFGCRNCYVSSAQDEVLYESRLLIGVCASWKRYRIGTSLAGLQTGGRLLIQRCEGGGASGDEFANVYGLGREDVQSVWRPRGSCSSENAGRQRNGVARKRQVGSAGYSRGLCLSPILCQSDG